MRLQPAALAALFIMTGCVATSTSPGVNVERRSVRILEDRLSSAGRSYSYQVLADPTGAAPTPRVERFEIRGGDCSGGDCTARPLNGRMVTRARTEKVRVADLRDGDEGWFGYSVYFPSAEHTFIESFGSTYGQLLALVELGGDSKPILSLDSDFRSRMMTVVLVEADTTEGKTASKRSIDLNLGNFGSSQFPTDRWISVEVNFKLSTDQDGFIKAYVNGRPIGQLTGRTILPGGYLEYRYGIYQTGTNQFVERHGGTLRDIPPQVVYFSNVTVARTRGGLRPD
jgi:hypothetical protein